MEQVITADKSLETPQQGGSLLDDVMGHVRKGVDYLKSVDWATLTKTKAFWFTIAAIVGLTLMFWPLFRLTGQKWMNDDYYSHGWIVPLLIAWQLKVREDRWAAAPDGDGKTALFVLIPLLFLQFVSFIGDFWLPQSLIFVGTCITAVWLLFGFKKAWVATFPLAFILFAMPVWGSLIDNHTNTLQYLSTTVAEMLLNLFQFSPTRLSPTEIQLNSYALTVAVPCSGLKLLVAVACFTAHFILIAKKDLFFNFLMAALVVPLCLFINGLRIALIGVVGEMRGPEAALQFHDYSGYITLLLCFVILFKFARVFGWKD
ncbi:MAG TPA: exosortase/archaeosortase family protein [Fimbriimonas sp.]|nr:exosortase/archaeosortase family protein [Fimbriimonas sp.]